MAKALYVVPARDYVLEKPEIVRTLIRRFGEGEHEVKVFDARGGWCKLKDIRKLLEVVDEVSPDIIVLRGGRYGDDLP